MSPRRVTHLSDAARGWRDALLFVLFFLLALAVCDPSPAATLDQAAQERTMNRYLTEPEQQRLLDVLKRTPAQDLLGRRDAAVVRALMYSGLRIGEFSHVTLGQALDSLRSGYLFVPREHRKGWNRTKINPKTGALRAPPKDHSVFLTGALRQAVEDLLAVRAEMATGSWHASDPLVIGRRRERLSVRSFQARMKYWVAAAQLPGDFSPHWLRHTRGRNIVRRSTAKNPLGVVQGALGHVSVASTGIYTQVMREDVDRALEETDRKRGRISNAQLRRAYEERVAS